MTPEIMNEIALIREALDRMLAEAQPAPDRHAVLCAVAEQMALSLERSIETLKAAGRDTPVLFSDELFNRWIPEWEQAIAAFETWKEGA